jgi:hypothetical protein
MIEKYFERPAYYSTSPPNALASPKGRYDADPRMLAIMSVIELR